MKPHILPFLKQIPQGKVSTYGDFAKFFGIPNSPRWVGKLIGKNPDPDDCPCYKVVGSDGYLTGFSSPRGLQDKKERLEQDGITVEDLYCKNLKDIRWQPQFSSYFLALPLSEDQISLFQKAVQKVEDILGQDKHCVKFQNPETSHVTLHYFGNLTQEELISFVSDLKEYEESFKNKKAVNFLFSGLQFFTNPEKECVGYVGLVKENKELLRLQEFVLQAIKLRNVRDFIPHMTIFYVKDEEIFKNYKDKIITVLQDFQFTFSSQTIRLYTCVNGVSQVPLLDFLS